MKEMEILMLYVQMVKWKEYGVLDFVMRFGYVKKLEIQIMQMWRVILLKLDDLDVEVEYYEG